MDGAGTAKSCAAAEFGAGHAEHVAQNPKQRRVCVDIDRVVGTVDIDGKGHGGLVRCWWLGNCDRERRLHTRDVISARDHGVEKPDVLSRGVTEQISSHCKSRLCTIALFCADLPKRSDPL